MHGDDEKRRDNEKTEGILLMSARNRPQMTLEEAQEKLYQVAEYIHSLNQPLTTIFGQLDLLALRLEGSAHKIQIDKCLQQAEKVTQIINRIAAEYPRRPD